MSGRRKPLLCAGTTAYAEVFVDTHEGSTEFEFVGFLENLKQEKAGSHVHDLPVFWSDDAAELSTTHSITCALATTRRKAWIEELGRKGFSSAILVHPTACLSKRTDLAPGVVIDPGTVIAARTRIDHSVRIGRLCAIGHHIEIGAFSTIHPSVTLSGGCRIGAQVTLATGVTVINDITIGEGAFVAAGSLVTNDVPPGALARGSPARVIKEGFGPR